MNIQEYVGLKVISYIHEDMNYKMKYRNLKKKFILVKKFLCKGCEKKCAVEEDQGGLHAPFCEKCYERYFCDKCLKYDDTDHLSCPKCRNPQNQRKRKKKRYYYGYSKTVIKLPSKENPDF
jgi:hypothetical protein